MAVVQQGAPFLRWAGSKRWLVHKVVQLAPTRYGRYFEPFLGSGVVFFGLSPNGGCTLGDAIPELIECYRCVQDDSSRVVGLLEKWQVDAASYYEVRSLASNDPFERAAKFIYLNKTAFNGLYRVNKSGAFNVPFGRPKNDRITTREDLAAASEALAGAELFAQDFDATLANVQKGDLVYLDPPYVAGHRANGFVDYNSKLFRWEDQVRLRETFARLDALGAYVILSNANHPSVSELYADYRVTAHNRHSSMAASVASRGDSSEILVIGETLAGSLNG